MVEIRRYTPADEPGLYDLIRSEGNEWRGYWSRWTAYVQAARPEAQPASPIPRSPESSEDHFVP
jgi:hypothetical protein